MSTDTIYFHNKGEFDMLAMTTFGVCAKETDSPIGFFGTGFKYAVAIILRLGGKISVHTLSTYYEFGTIVTEIRGQSFDVVSLNKKPIGFTTALGKSWEPWQAFRELYCNCLDESGTIGKTLPITNEGTLIVVELDSITDAYHNRQNYFLESTPLARLPTVEIHSGQRQYFFYRGIAVAPCHLDTQFTYNILSSVTLTEDRTAKDVYTDIVLEVAWGVQRSMEDPALLREILTSKREFENTLPYNTTVTPSATFLDTCVALKASHIAIPDAARRVAIKNSPDNTEWKPLTITNVQQTMLSKASTFLLFLNIDVSLFPIYPVSGLGDGVLGRAYKGNIYISSLAFENGTKQVASTLLEEWVHLHLGHKDFGRPIQNWLFDKILSLGEDISGSPI